MTRIGVESWFVLTVIIGLVILALTMDVVGETQTWDDEGDFEGGEFDAVLWDADSNGLVLTGKETFLKDKDNPSIGEGTGGDWDDEGVFDPCVVFAKGQYYVYYTGYDGTDYAIGLAMSDDGISPSKYGSSGVVTKGTGGSYDGSGCIEPSVIYEDGLFKMWYTGLNGATESIAYATSVNGLSWTKYGSNPVLTQPGSGWGSNEFGDPSVIKVDGRYYMYLSGSASLNNKLVGLATSKDGTSWTYYGSNPIISKATSPAFGQQEICDVAVVKDGPVFRMYFTGRNGAGVTYKIGYGESFDGYEWTLGKSIFINLGASGTFDDTQLRSPGVILGDDGVLRMYYAGDDATDYEIGITTSMSWLEKPNPPSNKLLGTGSDYDSTHLFDPCVIKTNSGTYTMFYRAFQSSNTSYSIAMASSNNPNTGWSKYGSNPVIGMGQDVVRRERWLGLEDRVRHLHRHDLLDQVRQQSRPFRLKRQVGRHRRHRSLGHQDRTDLPYVVHGMDRGQRILHRTCHLLRRYLVDQGHLEPRVGSRPRAQVGAVLRHEPLRPLGERALCHVLQWHLHGA
jgi:predicted GH43/DUF377 family glycosyl hydrolase